MAACYSDHGQLSEQNIVDCALSSGADGCDGGDPVDGFQYAQKYSLESEQSYPYIDQYRSVVNKTFDTMFISFLIELILNH